MERSTDLKALQAPRNHLCRMKHVNPELVTCYFHILLSCSNIMEHSSDPKALQALRDDSEAWKGHVSPASAALARGLLTFKILDFGHSKVSAHVEL
jgi:hypothetical protein